MTLFYPSHDIALGNGVRHFNPPAAALSLQEDLSWLTEIWNKGLDNPLPWGWDWDTREYMCRSLGYKRSSLPSDEDLEKLRQLSSRQTTITILEKLKFDGPMPRYLTSIDELQTYISDMDEKGAKFVLKTPWSSSGRGLIMSSVTERDKMLTRGLSTIKKMGGIMAESWFNKVQDFAMLFFVGQKNTSFIGYSLFDNEDNGTYRQGYLMSNSSIEKRLTSLGNGSITHDKLTDIQSSLLKIFDALFEPFYGHEWQVGYIGVDMMVVRNGEWLSGSGECQQQSTTTPQQPTTTIHPCVELNMRCTMGVVARLWADQNLSDGQTGRFTISPMNNNGHFEARFEIDK